ncbi:MAG: CinA family protein [Thioclava marina]|uniref:CinA family protein n=1 Tax=Thioclava marina TaxID=1915077 RepID=UPI0019B0181F|nr:CinA family protein [Thioclava marina]MBC7144221.1 CinA family protein [Thioclava marina]
MSLAAEVLEACKARGWMLATAESCTGGMVCAALTDIAGSSAVVERGFVTYTNAAKREMLGVRAQTLDAHGAVSDEVAREMAEGARAHAPVQLAVAITGIAGPGGSEFKPEGRVCFGLACEGHKTLTETVEFGAAGRENVRKAARDHALRLLLSAALS